MPLPNRSVAHAGGLGAVARVAREADAPGPIPVDVGPVAGRHVAADQVVRWRCLLSLHHHDPAVYRRRMLVPVTVDHVARHERVVSALEYDPEPREGRRHLLRVRLALAVVSQDLVADDAPVTRGSRSVGEDVDPNAVPGDHVTARHPARDVTEEDPEAVVVDHL